MADKLKAEITDIINDILEIIDEKSFLDIHSAFCVFYYTIIVDLEHDRETAKGVCRYIATDILDMVSANWDRIHKKTEH